MSATESGTLAIAGALTVANAAARWRELQPRAAGAERIDLAGVDAIDSAGVALVQALREGARNVRGRAPAILNPPPRMQQLCVAHRVVLDGN